MASSRGRARHMTSIRPGGKRVLSALALLVLIGIAGCAQVDKLKSRVGERLVPHRSARFIPAVPAVKSGDSASPALTTIINDQLQRGHYAEGERALRRHLARHPDDRAAQAMLRQLTVDPERMLGRSARNYIVRTDDSYSSLADRYLGDPSLFLVLARYNHSVNPSKLRKGETVRIPLAAARASTLPEVAAHSAENAGPTASATPSTASSLGADIEMPAAKATRLQRESLALLDQGHKDQALARMDQALRIDPHLQPSGSQAASLRQQLLATYHQRAIVLYRNQQLDPAIDLWDHVLAIDPDYERAVVYRERARELKQRLKQY